MMNMQKNDLLLRAAKRLPVERVPVWLMRQAGRCDPAYRALRKKINLPLERLFNTVPGLFSAAEVEWVIEISLLPRRIGVDSIIMYHDILTPLAPMGAHFRFSPAPLLESPIRTRRQVAELVPVDDPVSQLEFTGKVINGLRSQLDGELPLIGFAGAPLTLAFFMIAGKSPMVSEGRLSPETDLVFRMMREAPDVLHDLLERLTQMTIHYLNYQVSEGVQIVQLFESIADGIERSHYEIFAQPYHERIFSELDSSVSAILFAKECPYLDLLLKSGADVLSVGKCIDLREAHVRGNGRVAFQGNVDNDILRDGSLEDVSAAVNRCLTQAAKRGQILNLNHGVHRDTPFENVKQFVKAAKAHVWNE